MLTDQRALGCSSTSPLRLELVLSAGVAAGLLGWGSGGHAVAVPIAVVALLSVQAAICDARTLIISNALIVAGLTTVALGVPFVATVDHRSLSSVVAGAAAGWVLAGSPALFVLWLIRPNSVGGGDWKLITVQSMTIGLLVPYTAPLILVGGSLGGALYRVTRRRVGVVPFGPGVAAGYLAAISVAVSCPELLGGPYT